MTFYTMWSYFFLLSLGKDGIDLGDLESKLTEMGNAEGNEINLEKLKLASLYFVCGVLGPIRRRKQSPVDPRWLSLIEDFTNFNNYPWGKHAYDEAHRSLNKDLNAKLRAWKDGQKKKRCMENATYDISGFVQPLQVNQILFFLIFHVSC